MLEEFMNHGSRVDAVYACPHYPSKHKNRCNCRKPLPGLILEAISRYELSVEHSFLVGDKESDISAAKAAGIDKTALVRNSAINYKETNSAARWYVEDLIEFSSIIKKIHDY
jgi:D-glycero-D-manno-heptose 1,7-bisphosphate phosphatase